MGCVLKPEGKDFQVDAFLEGSDLIPSRVFRKGELQFPRTQPNGEVWDSSRIIINIDRRGFDNLQEQIAAATAYLKEHEREIARLCKFSGVEHVYLDFGVRKHDEPVVECNYFSPELLSLSTARRLVSLNSGCVKLAHGTVFTSED
jgi:hypothetical protein